MQWGLAPWCSASVGTVAPVTPMLRRPYRLDDLPASTVRPHVPEFAAALACRLLGPPFPHGERSFMAAFSEASRALRAALTKCRLGIERAPNWRHDETGLELISFEDVVRFHPLWSEEDRQAARAAIAWARSRDPGVRAGVPAARHLVKIIGSDGRPIIILREGYMRIQDPAQPPLDGAEPGVRSGSWEIPLSRRQRRR